LRKGSQDIVLIQMGITAGVVTLGHIASKKSLPPLPVYPALGLATAGLFALAKVNGKTAVALGGLIMVGAALARVDGAKSLLQGASEQLSSIGKSDIPEGPERGTVQSLFDSIGSGSGGGSGDTPSASAGSSPRGIKPVAGNYQRPGPHGAANNAFGTTEAADIFVPVGTPVVAVDDGRIGTQIGPLNSSNPALAGERLHLFTNGNQFYYAHLSRILVRPNQEVKAGDVLGYSGTANGAAHLHFEVRNGQIEDWI
jgi:murein DD-endopeptidase MepM/ murein hydrolase activator NlpD